MSRANRILVVDDNASLRENLAEALQLEGYEVVVAADGAGALALLEADPLPEVVLLDLVMPRMDGRELARRIRQDRRLDTVRLVLTTGHEATARAGVAVEAVLMKPFGVGELLEALKRVGA